MDKMGIIYKATNKINGKCYIGQTKFTLEKRKLEHENSSYNCYFHKALKKYGLDNFSWEIIENGILNLNKKEIFYINEYNSFKNGYNLTIGGEGFPISEKTKKKISKSLMGRFVGKNNPFYGKTHSNETKAKLSEIAKNRKHSKETKEKIRQSSLGRMHTEESKIKMSNMKKGQKHTKETKEKFKIIAKERIFSDETKNKLRENLLKRKRDKNGKFIGGKICGN